MLISCSMVCNVFILYTRKIFFFSYIENLDFFLISLYFSNLYEIIIKYFLERPNIYTIYPYANMPNYFIVIEFFN